MTTIQVRRGTAASAAADNPTLAAGEFGYETDTGKLKIGDGATAWNALKYTTDLSLLPASVQSVGTAYADGRLTQVVNERLSFTDPRVGGVADGLSGTPTDNGPLFAKAFALSDGGELFFPPGVYGFETAPAYVPGGWLLTGTGFDYSNPTEAVPPQYASVLMALAQMSALIVLGEPGSNGLSTPGVTGGSIERLSINGNNLAGDAVQTQARRNQIRNSQVYWGMNNAINLAGQNSRIYGGVARQNDQGNCINVSAGADHKIYQVEPRQPGGAGNAAINITAAVPDVLIEGIHTYAQFGSGITSPSALIQILAGCPNVTIVGNIVESVAGPGIFCSIPSGQVLSGLMVANNTFFNPATGGPYPIMAVAGPGSMTTVNYSDNVAVDGGYESWLHCYGGSPYPALASSADWFMDGNVGGNVATIVLGLADLPQAPKFGQNIANPGSGASTYTRNGGTTNFSGNGSQTNFVISHGLFSAPTQYSITPTTAAAAVGSPYVSAVSAGAITVTYASAPPAGNGNVGIAWTANC